jgi:hypothetical protein
MAKTHESIANLAPGNDETFRLSESQAQELKAAVRDIASGNFVTLKGLLDSLPVWA